MLNPLRPAERGGFPLWLLSRVASSNWLRWILDYTPNLPKTEILGGL